MIIQLSTDLIVDEFKKERVEKDNSNLHITPFQNDILELIKNDIKNYKIKLSNIVACIIDNTVNTKFVFTGEEFYYHTSVKEGVILFNNIEKTEYIIANQNISVCQKNNICLEFNVEELGENFPYSLLSEILSKLKSSDVIIKSLDQLPSVKNLSSHSKVSYFKILITFLKSDDGIIDAKEYQELSSVMANVNASDTEVKELREYRYENTIIEKYEDLITELKESLVTNDGIEPKAILQSLAADIINMQDDKTLQNWKDIEHLVEVFKYLEVSNSQVNNLITIKEKQKQMLIERLDNSKMEALKKEIGIIMGASGIYFTAPRLLGAYFIPGLNFILGIGTLVGVGYKAIKALTKSNKEKYSIQIDILNSKIKSLVATNAYIIADINYINEKNSELIQKLEEQKELDLKLISEIKRYISIENTATQSCMDISGEQESFDKEILFRKLPEELDINLYDKLAVDSLNYSEYNDVIYSVYRPLLNVPEKYELEETSSTYLLEKAIDILEEIKYFDSTTAALSKTKDVVENILNTDNVKQGFGKVKSFFKK